jgi:methylated-DNA-[protein]-cysteine S-methyltransferase
VTVDHGESDGAMELHATTLSTPAGPLTLVVDGSGVCAAGFGDSTEPLRRLDRARRSAPIRQLDDLGDVSAAVGAYLGGDLDALDAVPVSQPGDPAQQAAWRALRTVRAGLTVTYRELAELARLEPDPATDPHAAQAAGAACASNNVAVLIPCHRVLRADAGVGGYRWGPSRKRWLLAHEGNRLPV